MQGLRKLVGGLGLLLIAAMIAGVFWGYLRMLPLLDSANEYLARAVPAIARSWDREQLLSRMTPELRNGLGEESLDSIYGVFEGFGPLTDYRDGSCSIPLLSVLTGARIVATCTAMADCEKARVRFRLGLARTSDYWEIESFFVTKAGDPAAKSYGFGPAPSGRSP